MGAGNSSRSFASNVARLQANTNVATTASCSATQSVIVKGDTFLVDKIDCAGKITIGSTKSTQAAVCNNQTQVAILSKIVSDQASTAKSASGIGSILNDASATANNFVDIQNNVSAIMQSSCNNEQTVSVENRSFRIGIITGSGDCDLLTTETNQQAMCTNSISADITNDSTNTQIAEATATSGADLGQILGILIAICVIMMLAMLFVPFMKIVMMGGKASSALKSGGGLFHSGGESVSSLRATLSALKSKLRAQHAAAV